MTRLLTLALLATAMAAVPVAVAQQPYPLRVPPEGTPPDMIQVSVSYSLSLPLSDDDEAAQASALEKGRRLVYGMAAGECKVLEATIATTCQMERLNVQSNVQHATRSVERVRIGANASYRIKLK